MKPFPPTPPRTIIVIDDSPSEVSSFLCSVLDAHALPYAVQVIDPGAPARDHRASRRLRRAGPGLWRRLTARGLAVMPLRGLRHVLQRHTTVRSSPPRRLQWPHGLAWGIGLGLVSVVVGVPWPWQGGWLPLGPSSPPPHRDDRAVALLGAAALIAPPATVGRLPAPSQTPATHTRLTSPALGATPIDGLLPYPRASVAQNVASLRPPTPARTRASRAARVRHPRQRYAPLRPAPRGDLITVRDTAAPSTRPRVMEHAQVVGVHRPEG